MGKNNPFGQGLRRVVEAGSGVTRKKLYVFSKSAEGEAARATFEKVQVDILDIEKWLTVLESVLTEEARTLPSLRLSNSSFTPQRLVDRSSYQSRDWYIGNLLLRCQHVRQQIKRGDTWGCVRAGVSLGMLKNEMDLKFKIEEKFARRLDRENKMTAGADKGNATKRKSTMIWKGVAQSLVSKMPVCGPSELATAALQNWPTDLDKPSHRTLRDFFSTRGRT